MLANTISPTVYDENPVPPLVAGSTPLKSDTLNVAHDGAASPLALKKPLEAAANKVVVPTADWYGIEPTLPPAIFVVVVAVVAEVAEMADVAVAALPVVL